MKVAMPGSFVSNYLAWIIEYDPAPEKRSSKRNGKR